uniref:AB hydrolase-1 domain-containing protein n=1 Tax=Panagrellus redivivus TaxID=6233 RepID=A0A7E4ZUY8_PANRE
MPSVPTFLRKAMLYLRGPEIYANLTGGPKYECNLIETIGNLSFNLLRAIARIAYCAWPFTAYYLYHKTGRCTDFSVFIFYFQIYSISILTRLFGRLLDKDYATLVDLLVSVYENPNDDKAKDRVLRTYDIELLVPLYKKVAPSEGLYYPDLPAKWSWFSPVSWISYVAIHAFGRRMIFPGSTLLLNQLVHKTLVDNRYKLINEDNARRIPVRSADGFTIDAIYIKNDGPKTVFVCDGNAGFYEGALWRNFQLHGNSIIAWNAPGFGASTGKPHSNVEMFNAADAVMKYAMTELNIPPKDIVIYGWSIGGLTASWLAANYDVHAVLLDATFDSILPLAHKTMPEFAADIVTYAIGSYFHMPVAEMVARYKGRVAIFRRVYDEIIVTSNDGTDQGRLKSNRANFLLETFLKKRYPFVKWTPEDVEYLHRVLAQPSLDSNLVGGPPFSMLTQERCATVAGEARKTMIRRLIHAYFFDVTLGHNAALPYHLCVVPEQYNAPN